MHDLYVDAEFLCAFFAPAWIASQSGRWLLNTAADESLLSKIDGMVPAKKPTHSLFNNKGDHDEN
jgi:hypothetical protein